MRRGKSSACFILQTLDCEEIRGWSAAHMQTQDILSRKLFFAACQTFWHHPFLLNSLYQYVMPCLALVSCRVRKEEWRGWNVRCRTDGESRESQSWERHERLYRKGLCIQSTVRLGKRCLLFHECTWRDTKDEEYHDHAVRGTKKTNVDGMPSSIENTRVFGEITPK